MRLPLATVAVLVLSCVPQNAPHPAPSDRFYFPVGVAQVPASDGSPDGILYVSNHNTDKRYDQGTVMAVKLANVVQPSGVRGLPPLGLTPSSAAPIEIRTLNIADGGQVTIPSFAGQIAALRTTTGYRLFLPTRDEADDPALRDNLNIVEAKDDALSCYAGGAARFCGASAPSLTNPNPLGDAGLVDSTSKPRAPQPYGVGLSADGRVWVTHVYPADDPVGSQKNLDTFIVELDAGVPFDPSGAPTIRPEQFHSLMVNGTYSGPADSVAAGARFVYISGRYVSPTAEVLRLYDTVNKTVLPVGVEANFAALDTRGLALNDSETRLYVATRSPDSLLVLSIEAADPGVDPAVGGAQGNNVRMAVIHDVPLPQGPNLVKIISRKAVGLGDLVVVTCSQASTVLIYDAELGQAVSEVPTVGSEPYGLAIDNRGASARLYVSNFGDGRVAVIDLPDLRAPQQAVLVAHLGAPQTCDITPTDASCDGGTAR